MAPPILMGVGLASSLASGLIGASGASASGAAQQQMYNYQAGVALLNKQIAEQNAEYTRNVGELQATKYGLQAAQQLGRIKVAQAASGLDVNSGSAAQIRSSQEMLTRTDLTQIRSNAAKTAYNFEAQGAQYGAQATLDTMAGMNARSAGMVNAASSIIGAAGSISSEWLQGQRLGAWGSGMGSVGAT